MTTDTEERPSAEERMKLLPPLPVADVEEARRWRRLVIIALMLAGVAVATSFIVAAFALGGQQEAEKRAGNNATAASEAKQQAGAAASAAEEANRRLRAAGKPTVPIPTVTVQPPVQVTGLSSDQVVAVRGIIENELSGYKLPASAVAQIAAAAAAMVPKPKDGHTPTVAEIKPLAAAAAQAALLSYCADGKCNPKPGPGGPSGPAGPSGAPGKPGQDAPAVTDAQLRPIVAEAFTAYCNQESRPCDGQKGEQGDQGRDGEMGRGIVSMLCPNDNDVLTADPWVIRWTKDPVQTEGGVCRAAGIP